MNKNIIPCGIRPVILKIFYEFYSKVKMKELPHRKPQTSVTHGIMLGPVHTSG